MKVLLVVIVLAVATYLVIRFLQDRTLPGRPGGGSPARGQQRPRRPQTPPRPVAPDDDEDFLRDLDRKRLDPPDS